VRGPAALAHPSRPAPLRMQPGEDAQGTDLNRPRRHDLHAPETVVVRSRNVDCPNGAARGDQAGPEFFCANTIQLVLRGILLNVLGNGNDGHELIRGLDVALASGVPVDVVAWR